VRERLAIIMASILGREVRNESDRIALLVASLVIGMMESMARERPSRPWESSGQGKTESTLLINNLGQQRSREFGGCPQTSRLR
jgi:hypothetical protein